MRSFKEYWNEHGDVYAMEIAEDAWDYQQTKVDELKLQVAEMKSRLNDAYTDGQSAMYAARQTKVDELQKQVTDLDNRATKYALDAMATAKLNAELQKRVDELQTAFKQLIEMENESISFEHDLFDKGWNQSARQTIENIYKLTGLGEQALKGESNESST
ncbi:hypothetical protein F972_01491 [Acinetobacter sp. CIP 102529]|uniref:hypothetical protein n=1 Tax=Acinetobacter sp. CIP 102529 TaxID=1144668 RepID=UPI0002CFE367|nr:hypothetical protein [Acinetobacter sp. CIP 102529]ENU89236.1 hypothetical protein F972_01491 [Acinetobacter sp. CIP 102529]